MNKQVTAMDREAYTLPQTSFDKMERAKGAWWATPWFITLFTLAMFMCDGAVLYGVFDMAIKQVPLQGYVISFALLCILNVTPLVTARFLKEAVYKTKKYAWVMALAGLLVFSGIYGTTVNLRFAHTDYYAEESTNEGANEMDGMIHEEVEEKAEEKAEAVVWVMALEPLATSILIFLLGWLSDDPVERRVYMLGKRELELLEMMGDVEAALDAIDYNVPKAIEIDARFKETAIDELRQKELLMQSIARGTLAAHLGTSDAVTCLS